MTDMKDDEWHMFWFTYLCRHDTALFHELMGLEEPTLARVLAATNAWENTTKDAHHHHRRHA